MKNMESQFEVKPPSGSSPRPEDTPRTKNLKELRMRRLHFFEKKNNTQLGVSSTAVNTQDHKSNNQRDVNENVLADENVLPSMTRDSRVIGTAPTAKIKSQRPRELSRERVPDANRLYRNDPPPKPSLFNEVNNNHSNLSLRGNSEGFLLHGRSNVTGSSVQQNESNHSYKDSYNNSQSLGFTLPNLSPRDTSIINHGEAIPNIQTDSQEPGVSRKGKAVKGKKFKNSKSFEKGSAERGTVQSSINNPISASKNLDLSSNSETKVNDNKMSKDKHRRSVIEAEYEDDYSQLGLSVERVGFNRLSSAQPPSVSPGRKVKNRVNNSKTPSMRASKSAENFQNMRGNSFTEEKPSNVKVSDSNELFVKRSKTHKQLSGSVGESANSIDDMGSMGDFMKAKTSGDALNKVDLFQSTDGSSVLTSYQHHSSMPPENLKFGIGGNHSSNHQPAVAQSVEFSKSQHRLPVDNNERSAGVKQSVIRQEFQSATLESVLGKERMERLFKNLEESAWIEEEKSVVGSSMFAKSRDLTLESYRSEQDGDLPKYGLTEKETSKQIEELGLSTHRGPDNNYTKPPSSSQKPDESVSSDSRKGGTKYSFSSDQIYERARKASANSNDDSQMKAAQPSDHKMRLKDETSQFDNESNKFEFIRGIHGVKKEFYKTVVVTDSTAVSDTSTLNTAKQSRQSVDSPRGQIPKPKPTSPDNTASHKLSQSVGTGWPAGCSKEEHIEGIRQHVADIRIQKFEDDIRAGMPYTTSSIERYFASMEHLNLEAANGFEPVPEQEIIETPRGGKSEDTLRKSTKIMDTSSKSVQSDAQLHVQGVSTSKSFSEKVVVGNSSIKEQAGGKGKDKVLNGNHYEDDRSQTQRDKWNSFKLDNEKRKILSEMVDGDCSDDDDLFTKVTSMVDNMDGAMSGRLKKLGIDFEFLKKNDDSHEKSAQRKEIDVELTDDSGSDEVDFKPMNNSKTVNIAGKAEAFDKKVNNITVEDEVEFLFKMSPRNRSRTPSGNEIVTPEKSGEPFVSKTLKTSLKTSLTTSAQDKSLEESSASTSVSQVLVCPECAEVNKTYVTWCVECGAVLTGLDPVPCRTKRDATRHLGQSVNSNLSQSATNFKNRLEESMNNPPFPATSASGPKWGNQTRASSQQLTLSKSGFRGIDAKEVMQLKRDEAVRESDEFVYEKIESPVRALPKSLQSELSLDLNSKPEHPLAAVKKRKEGDKLAELSEGINFEYSEQESPKKSLPAALQEELNLNLSLDGSQNTASFQAGALALNKAVNKSTNSGTNYNNQRVAGNEAIPPRAGPSGLLKLQDVNNSESDGSSYNDDNVEDDNINGDDMSEDDVAIDLDETEEGGEKIAYKQFVTRLIKDPRFKPNQPPRPKSAAPPVKSSGRPKSAIGQRARPQSASVTSKVRASLEKEGYQRKWGLSSTTAWSSKSHGEIRARSSLHASADGEGVLSRPTSGVSTSTRPSSALRKSSAKAGGVVGAGGDARRSAAARPSSAVAGRGRQTKSLTLKSGNPFLQSEVDSIGPDMPTSQATLGISQSGSTKRMPVKNLMNTYAKYFEMTPRIASGEFSQWLCLPDEIWLHILACLPHGDLARLAQTCMQLHRVALDESLWRKIVVKKKHHFTDEWLVEIGRRQPSSLSLVQCHGENVTANGVRELFRQCSDSLKELNFTGCSRGELTGDSILLHAAARCRHISHIDTSWSNVNDNGVMALIDASHSLEGVCLNGCQVITDEAIHSLVAKHGQTLSTLELFGCFNVTQRSAQSISNYCKSLTVLNLGQCWKLTDASITQLAPSLTEVINIDLRGVKQMKDQTVHQLMYHCKRLQSLSLANCPNLTDVSLTGIATYCSTIRSLDLCGCRGISDMGVRALAMACHNMDYLDVSSTPISHKSVSSLASYCHANLEVLKLNFVKHITIPSLVRLAKNCKKIRKVYLYGVNGIRNIHEVRKVNSNLWIEM